MATDLQFRNEVLAEMAQDPSIRADEVTVAVHDGVVLLSGCVDSFAAKHALERAVHRVRGVRAVALDVHVTLPEGQRRGDASIAIDVRSAFARHPRIPNDRLQVHVERGWVALTGEVDWEIQRHSAEVLAAQVTGVEQVFNQITLREREGPGRAEAPAHAPAPEGTVGEARRPGQTQASPWQVADPADASIRPPAPGWSAALVTGVLSGVV